MTKELRDIKRLLLRKNPPEHFSSKQILTACIAALVLGLSFIFNSTLLQASMLLTETQLALIILSTIVVLTFEIYVVGYARVKNKARRQFGQFWAKRFFTFYGISIAVSVLVIYLYGLDGFAGGTFNTLKIAIAASFPCAVGTAFSDLVNWE